MRAVAGLALAAMLVTGCSVPTARPGGQAPTSTDAQTQRESAQRAEMLLLEDARSERAARRYETATTLLERALRIAPNDPLLWIELGEIKAEEGDREQADLMARKALTLAAGNASIEARAARLID